MNLGISRGPNVVVRSGSARWAIRVLAGAGVQVTLGQILQRVMEPWRKLSVIGDKTQDLPVGKW